MVILQCEYIKKDGKRCSKVASIGGLCVTHYCIEEGIPTTHNYKRVDVTTHLWKGKR